MDTRFFAGLEEVNEGIQNGEISGFTSWPLEGQATLDSVRPDYKNGNPYFFIKLIHGTKGSREFALKVPVAGDKDTAKFMSMQRIYGTLYPLGKATPGKISVQAAYELAIRNVGSQVNFKLEEYESFSEKHGKMFTNQSLASLELAEQGEFA